MTSTILSAVNDLSSFVVMYVMWKKQEEISESNGNINIP